MGLNIYSREHIQDVLVAADEICWSLGSAELGEEIPPNIKAFLIGYRKALVTIALAFGLSRDFTRKGEQDASHQGGP